MRNQEGSGEAWEQAVAEATEHVHTRSVVEAEAAEQQKPKSKAPQVAAASVILIGLTAWNVVQWMAPPPAPNASEERAHLAWLVGDVVDEVEAFEEEFGRFPTYAELEDLFSEDVGYAPATETYAVTADGDSLRVEYESTTPIGAWMRAQGATAVESQQ